MVTPPDAVLVRATGTPQKGSWVDCTYGGFPFLSLFVGVSMSAAWLLTTPQSPGHPPHATLEQPMAEEGGCDQSPLQHHCPSHHLTPPPPDWGGAEAGLTAVGEGG